MLGDKIRMNDLEKFVDRYSLGFERGEDSRHFLRAKIPGGKLSTEQFRGLAKMAEDHSRGYAEITDRQDIQLHWLNGEDADSIFASLEQIGFSTDKCGQAYPGARYGDVRNVVGCPASGVDCNEVFDASPIVEDVTNFFTGNRDFMDLPRKFKMSISGCYINCTAPEIQDLSFVAVKKQGRNGFSLLIGGGVGVGARLAEPMGVFVEPQDVLEVAKSFVKVFSTHGQRDDKAKARFKWLVKNWGIEKMRLIVEKEMGKQLEGFEKQPHFNSSEHIGINQQKQNGYSYITVPILGGMLSTPLMLKLADIAERHGWPELRLTTSQNIILVGIQSNKVANVEEELKEVGFNIHAPPLTWKTIACAGNFCGKSPENVKTRASDIVKYLIDRFQGAIQDLCIGISVSGCPNGCARHLIADIGLQSIFMKKDEQVIPAYNLYLGGGFGKRPTLAKIVKHGIKAEHIKNIIGRVITIYSDRREDRENFQKFISRHTTEELLSLIELNNNSSEAPING
jgi:sulfite reductase beta subunit-like hemoprotein